MTERRSEPSNQQWIDDKRRARMDRIDSLPPEVREIVHEYGSTVVNALIECGVSKPRHMRHIIVTVISETSPLAGSWAAQGPRGPYGEKPKVSAP
jgi:hypothetical protein